MDINRRSFIKGITAGAIISVVNPLGLVDGLSYFPKDPRFPNFNPKHQYGDVVGLSENFSRKNDPIAKLYLEALREQAGCVVPPRYRKNVSYNLFRAKPSRSDPLGQRAWSAWVYKPNGKGGITIGFKQKPKNE